MNTVFNRVARKSKRGLAKIAFFGRNIRYENFFQNDNVAIFPKLGLIFNRIKKSGNTSIVATLSEIEGKIIDDVGELKSMRTVHAADFHSIVMMRSWKTLVVVRNPYNRSLSGFLEKVASGKSRNGRFDFYPGFGEQSAEAFEQFLEHLKEHDYGKNRHFFRQTDLLFQNLSKYTCVAKLENLAQEIVPLLIDLGCDPIAARKFYSPHDLEKKETGKITNSSKRTSMISPKAKKLIQELYREDFEQFGYDM